MVLCLCSMCQCGLHAVLRTPIGILMHLLAAEPRRTARLSFPSLCLCGPILLTNYSMVWDWRVLRARPILFWGGLSCSLHFCLLLFSLFLLSFGWYRGAGVFGLMGCNLLSHSLHCRLFNNNNNNNNNGMNVFITIRVYLT